MRAVAVVTVTAEYDLLDETAHRDAIESYFRKPLATWDPASLEPGEHESVSRAFVRSSATSTIEIDRADHVVWATYSVTIELDYSQRLLEYFGTGLDSVIRHACQVSFPLDERVVELVNEERTISRQ